MTNSSVLLAVSVALAMVAFKRDRTSPVTWALWLWAGVLTVHVTGALMLEQLDGMTVLIITLGLLAMSAPTLLVKPRRLEYRPQADRTRSLSRLVLIASLLGLLVVIGAIAFRTGIASVVGTDFSELNLQQVRAAQNGAARGGGLLALFGSLNPLLACIGIYGAYRFSRLWFTLVPIAVIAVMQSPARTSTLSLLVILLVFWLYARTVLSKSDTPKPRTLPVGWITAALTLGLVYFLTVGSALAKNDASTLYALWAPSWLASPLNYFAGGASALSVAIENSVQPFEFGTSVYWPMKILSFFIPSVSAPDTIGLPVPAPMWFNLYTGFGQIFFDFGTGGVVILSAAIGALAVYSHRMAKGGRLEWAWVSGVTAALLFSTPQSYRLFNLDVLTQLVVGYISFVLVSRAPRIKKSEALRREEFATQ